VTNNENKGQAYLVTKKAFKKSFAG